MKAMRFLAVMLVLMVGSVASAQGKGVVMTHPTVPNRDTLARIGLEVGWRTRIQLPESPDSMRSVQLLTHGSDLQIAVQSLSGSVYLIDAQTGDLRWSTPVGNAYWHGESLGHNDQNIYVTRKNILYVLDRKTGRHRVYTVGLGGAKIDFGYTLPNVPSGGPTASGSYIYLPMSNVVSAYSVPLFEVVEMALRERLGGLYKVSTVQPKREFGAAYADLDLTQQPLVFGDQVSFVTKKGLFGINRFNGEPLFRFQTTGNVEALVGQHENIAYVPSTDGNLYAVNLLGGREPLLWRYISPGPIREAPAATDKYLFVTSEGKGMAMLERERGVELWRNAQAERFLALSDRFVYAMDRHGKLLVLDLRKGAAQGQIDMGDWQVRLANEYTDRIFLANHDGQILCMHPRGSATPAANKSRPIEAKDPEPKEPKEKEKDAEKDKDKEKDIEKKDVEKKDVEKKDIEKKDVEKKEGAYLPGSQRDQYAARERMGPEARRHTLPPVRNLSLVCVSLDGEVRRSYLPWLIHSLTDG